VRAADPRASRRSFTIDFETVAVSHGLAGMQARVQPSCIKLRQLVTRSNHLGAIRLWADQRRSATR
jgi:hypothetical protein